jgi:ABC-2 type transport system permease protein
MAAFLDLWRQRLRRDRWQLAVWIAAVLFLAVFAVAAIAKTYGAEAERTQILQVASATPAILMLRGLARGPGEGAFLFFEMYAFLAVLAGFMSTFLAVRHSRAEEEQGRAELVAATPAGRILPMAATAVHGVVANVLLAAAVAVGFTAGGMDPYGSLVAGAATGAVGVAFVGVGLVCGELLGTSRGANGLASGLVMAAYVLRGFGDATATFSADATVATASWPSWLSPIGWGQQTFPYSGERWWPLLLPLALAAVCVGAVAAAMARRDVGASVLPERTGRAEARPALATPFALAARLQLGSIVGWSIGGLATGLVTGSLGAAISAATTTDASVTTALRSMIQAEGTSMTQLVVSALFSIAGVLAAACALQAVIRMRQEETEGLAATVMAQPVGRAAWAGSFLGVGALSVALVMAFAALGAWASLVASGDTSEAVADVWATAVAQLPAALVYLAVPALVFAVWPSATVPLGWGLLGAGVLLGIFGGMIGIDQALRDISPFTHTPVPSPSGWDWGGGLWMLAVSAVAAAAAVWSMRRREVGSA